MVDLGTPGKPVKGNRKNMDRVSAQIQRPDGREPNFDDEFNRRGLEYVLRAIKVRAMMKADGQPIEPNDSVKLGVGVNQKFKARKKRH